MNQKIICCTRNRGLLSGLCERSHVFDSGLLPVILKTDHSFQWTPKLLTLPKFKIFVKKFGKKSERAQFYIFSKILAQVVQKFKNFGRKMLKFSKNSRKITNKCQKEN